MIQITSKTYNGCWQDCEYGLRTNKEKFEFKSRISCCGHVMDKDGLHKLQDKIEAVLNVPHAQNVSQLRSYLGLVNYYQTNFFQTCPQYCILLNTLLQTRSLWKWSDSYEQAFQKTKKLITSDVVLAHFNPSMPIRLACDASPYGIGAVLSRTFPDGTSRKKKTDSHLDHWHQQNVIKRK